MLLLGVEGELDDDNLVDGHSDEAQVNVKEAIDNEGSEDEGQGYVVRLSFLESNLGQFLYLFRFWSDILP